MSGPPPGIELYISRTGEPERRMVLQPGILQIGRAEDNDVVLADVGVSRRHARLEVTPEGLVVEDLGSGNGTFFRGKRIDRQVLGHGDEVVVEPFILRVAIQQPSPEITDSHDATAKAAPTIPPARLTVVSAHRMPQRDFPLVPGAPMTIGRSERNAIVLPEPASSRVHAELAYGAEGWLVRDMGSSNGTFVNARRVKEKRLEDGDRIRIGTVELRFAQVGSEAGDGTEAYNENLHDAASAMAPVGHVPAGHLPATLPPPPPPPPATSAFAAAQPLPAVLHNAPTHVGDPPPSNWAAPATPAATEIEIDPGRSRARKLSGRARKSNGFFSRPINQLSLGILALAFVLVGGKLLNDGVRGLMGARAGSTAAASSAAPPAALSSATGTPSSTTTASAATPIASDRAPTPAAAPLDPATTASVEAGMAKGMADFAAGRYFDAAAAFYRVLKDDPHNRDARRMGYVACEFITLSEVRTALVARTTSAAALADAKTRALAALQAAIDGAGSTADARAAIEAALALAPGDAELQAAAASLSTREESLARAISAGRAEARTRSLDALVAQGQSELSSGQYAKAVRTFEGVLAGDATHATPAYYAAEEGIRTAKDRMKADSKAAWTAANSAMKSGDWLAARTKLKEVLRVDPFNESAQTKLSEAQRKLKEDASELYKEARVLEDIQQTEKALALYQKVIRYVDDTSDPLARKAQARMDDLLR